MGSFLSKIVEASEAEKRARIIEEKQARDLVKNHPAIRREYLSMRELAQNEIRDREMESALDLAKIRIKCGFIVAGSFNFLASCLWFRNDSLNRLLRPRKLPRTLFTLLFCVGASVSSTALFYLCFKTSGHHMQCVHKNAKKILETERSQFKPLWQLVYTKYGLLHDGSAFGPLYQTRKVESNERKLQQTP